jgi:hypothetical protein
MGPLVGHLGRQFDCLERGVETPRYPRIRGVHLALRWRKYKGLGASKTTGDIFTPSWLFTVRCSLFIVHFPTPLRAFQS